MGLSERGVDGRGIILLQQATALCTFKAGNQPRQRCAQVVGNVITHALDLTHQAFEFIEHAVDHIGQAIDVVAVATGRQPAAKVTPNDFLDRRTEGIQPTSGRMTEDDRSDQTHDQQQAAARDQRIDQQLIELADVMHVLGDQQGVAIVQAVDHEANRVGVASRR